MYFNPETLGAGPRQPIAQSISREVASTTDSVVTVLTSVPSWPNLTDIKLLNKRYWIDESGAVQCSQYQNALLFDADLVPVGNIHDLAQLLQGISADPRKMIIRGVPKTVAAGSVRRTKIDFPEHTDGTFWVMLDFDDIPLPAGMDPLSTEAIDFVVAKLPGEFHDISYFYQFSNSAGILNGDGTPRKSGLNAHLFFWLNRRVPGKELNAYLQKHCIESGFYKIAENRGVVRVVCGIDAAPIRSSVQAHYTAAPAIGPDVQCTLRPESRQGIVTKRAHAVHVANLPADIVAIAKALDRDITIQYKKAHGYIRTPLQTKTAAGIATTWTYLKRSASAVGGRTLDFAELHPDGKFLRLYFADEKTPGSWFVVKDRPQIAYRFGGGESMLLKELSLGAHQHVRDELRWFSEIAHHSMSLTEQGYLPAVTDFATAKVSLVLAPTGAGKTTAAINWIRAKISEQSLVIYAAPTIALVNQMRQDLATAGVQHQYYRDVWQGNLQTTGVIVTTNESLRKMLGLIHDACATHHIILDEIHAGLDDFMKSNRKNETLENGISKARQTLLLTGTLTDVQRTKLASVVGHALSGLSEDHYCCYEFASVKQNPLYVRPLSCFDSDVVKLFEDLAQKVKDAAPLPRVVMILPTSKLDAYRTLLEQYGLSDHADVVSRPENDEDEIEAARTSTLPILISSPLFALGLNFESEPELFICRFDHLNADTNQIIQTVNRANRGQTSCEVRIYGNIRAGSRFAIPEKIQLKSEVADQLRQEASLDGILEDHFQVDRATYGWMRTAEKNSCIALSHLVEHDSIQNYRVITEPELPIIDKQMKETFKAHKDAARTNYLDMITTKAETFSPYETYACFWKFEQLAKEKRENWLTEVARVPLEIENDELGVVMVLCNLSSPQQARKVSIGKLKRLFGEASPWISAQYEREKFQDWAKVEAEKTAKLVVLVRKLGEIQVGTLSPQELSASLTRNKQLAEAFIALSSSEQEYLTLRERFETLRKAREDVKKGGSDKAKAKVQDDGMMLLGELLEPLGVYFTRDKRDDRKVRIDYTSLVVPATWNLWKMAADLDRQAARLRSLPADQKVPMLSDEDAVGEKLVSREICEACVFFSQNSCALGKPVDWQGGEWEGNLTTSCRSFKALKLKLAA